jgi:single-strand DNA-binding protein
VRAGVARHGARRDAVLGMNGITAAFVGRIGKDAEIRTTKTGKPWASFSVAVDTDKDAEAGTSWVRVALFGDTVDAMAPRLVKGVEVYVEGRLSLRNWTDPEGRERSGLSLATNAVVIMGQIGKRPREAAQPKAREEFDDPIPF